MCLLIVATPYPLICHSRTFWKSVDVKKDQPLFWLNCRRFCCGYCATSQGLLGWGEVDLSALTATHCNTLQRTATHRNTLQHTATLCHFTGFVRLDGGRSNVLLQCVAVCCNVLQCVAVCCSVLQCVAVCCSVLQCVAVCCRYLATWQGSLGWFEVDLSARPASWFTSQWFVYCL